MDNLNQEQTERYNRQIILPDIGEEGQAKLKAAKVLVVGAGGLGVPVLQYLTAAGIGRIGIVSSDSNIFYKRSACICSIASPKFTSMIAVICGTV